MRETTTGTGAGWKGYMWGLDLSGTEQGAGGVGGLLLFRDSAQGAHLPTYDGNGNVTKLISAANSTTTSEYEYAPFGQIIRMSGALASLNPIRFSSKYQDEHTDLSYYGYRFYDAALGRWVNRDPIEELGGDHLYSFVNNSPIGKMDFLGLYEEDFHYYVIYYLFRSRCFNPAEAHLVAWESQNIDDTSATSPLLNGFNEEILRDYHFFGSGPSTVTTRGNLDVAGNVMGALHGVTPDLSDAGRWLHTYADTWSHEGFTAWNNRNLNRRMGTSQLFIGHIDTAEGGHAPDRPYNDVNKALEAAQAIFDLIPNRCGCGPGIAPATRIGDLRRGFTNRGDREFYYQGVMRYRFGDDVHYDSAERWTLY